MADVGGREELSESAQLHKWLEEGPEAYQTFIRDMEGRGFEVEPYHGRWAYFGPAVRTGRGLSLREVVGATKVRCAYGSLGLGYVVWAVA